MANRVTAAEVLAIMDDVVLTDAQVAPYITGANAIVNEALGTGTSDILKEVERWMAAHMIAVTRERQAKKEGAGGASIEYAGEFGAGLRSTSYGQMVLALDTTGAMAALAGQKMVVYAVKSFD